MSAGIFAGVIATQEFALGLSQLGTDGSNPSPSSGESDEPPNPTPPNINKASSKLPLAGIGLGCLGEASEAPNAIGGSAPVPWPPRPFHPGASSVALVCAMHPSILIVPEGRRWPLLSRWLIAIGLVLVVVGLLWPWLSKIGLGLLPGDIAIERGNFTFYFPIVTCLIVSIVLSLVFWLMNR
jgi:hypothetical protein